eukprot:PITA_24375
MEEQPAILFLQETKCSLNFIERAAAKAWAGGQVTAVEAQGASGGLAILWDARKIQLTNIHANKSFIQANFHLIGGDFNMIANSEEKIGGRCRPNKDGSLLKDFIQSNWLIDLPTANGLYTWMNKRIIPMQIASRLDSKKPFRFEAFWLSHPEFKDFITTTWQNSNPIEQSKMARFQKKLKFLKGEIKKWNKENFGNIFKEKESILQDLKSIQQRLILEGRTEELAHKEQELESKL